MKTGITYVTHKAGVCGLSVIECQRVAGKRYCWVENRWLWSPIHQEGTDVRPLMGPFEPVLRLYFISVEERTCWVRKYKSRAKPRSERGSTLSILALL